MTRSLAALGVGLLLAACVIAFGCASTRWDHGRLVIWEQP